MQRRDGEAPDARASIDIMMGMILQENEDAAAKEEAEARTIADRRADAWQKMKDRLRALHVRGDLSKQEHDNMLARLTAQRDVLVAVRKKEEAARKAAQEAFALHLPPRPTVQAAFDIAKGAALRADGEDKPVETLEQKRRGVVINLDR